MDSWCTLGILKRMKTMRKEQYGLVWEFLLPWETSILVCNERRVSTLVSVWAFILDWWWSVKWVGQGDRNNWHWGKFPMWLPVSKGWQSRIRSSSPPLRTALCEATSSARHWANTRCEEWLSP